VTFLAEQPRDQTPRQLGRVDPTPPDPYRQQRRRKGEPQHLRTLDNLGRSDLVEGAKRRLQELARTPSRKRLIDVTTTGTFGYHHRHDLPVVAC
jgi:hypothetical protein